MTISSIIYTIIQVCLAWMFGEAAYQAYRKTIVHSHKQEQCFIRKYNPITDDGVEETEYIEIK